MVLKRFLESDIAGKDPSYSEKFIRILVHIASLIPAGILLFDGISQNLTADPIQAIMQRTGQIAIIWLFLSLACTPINIIFGFRLPLKFKKTLGLYSFLYAAIHFLTFLGLDYRFNLSFILADINNKSYIFAGLAAFTILTTLAITSIRAIKRQLGKTWKRIHRFVYAAGILAVIHYLWVVKGDIRQPAFYTFILAMLLSLRLPFIRAFFSQMRNNKVKAKE